MKAERIYSWALAAYPDDYRDRSGDELISTALELNDDAWSVRETAGLVAGGMRARARAGLSGPNTSLALSAVRVALFLMLCGGMASVFVQSPGTEVSSAFQWGLAGLLAVWLLVMTRSTGVGFAAVSTSVTLVALVWTFVESPVAPPMRFYLLDAAVLVGLWWVALRGDGRPVASLPTTVVTVAGIAGFLSLAPNYYYGVLPFDSMGQTLAMVALGLVGCAVAHLDPRLLAGTLAWFLFVVAWSATNHTLNYDPIELLSLLGIGFGIGAAMGVAVWNGTRKLNRV